MRYYVYRFIQHLIGTELKLSCPFVTLLPQEGELVVTTRMNGKIRPSISVPKDFHLRR